MVCQGARGEQGLVGVSLRYVLCLVKRGGGRDWMGRDGRGERHVVGGCTTVHVQVDDGMGGIDWCWVME